MVKFPAKNKDKTFFSEDLAVMIDASGRDILKELGPISKKEYDYYKSLKVEKMVKKEKQ